MTTSKIKLIYFGHYVGITISLNVHNQKQATNIKEFILNPLFNQKCNKDFLWLALQLVRTEWFVTSL